MRLKKEQVHKLAEQILRNLKAKNLLTFRKKEPEVLEAIVRVIHDDLEAEVKLDHDARQMMETYRAQIQAGSVDEQRLFQMIKKQLAKDRKLTI